MNNFIKRLIKRLQSVRIGYVISEKSYHAKNEQFRTRISTKQVLSVKIFYSIWFLCHKF